jgi:uncharacterized protein with GYD domain
VLSAGCKLHNFFRSLLAGFLKEELMATFIFFLNWTDQGAKNVKDVAKRAQNARTAAEKLKGRIHSAYITTGQYDVVATVELPDGDAAVKFAAAISAAGNARTTTVRGWTAEEFSKLAAEAPSV